MPRAMSTFIVLLRGVTVGKAKRVPMADLRDLLAELGCHSVATLLNSGNAVVEATGTKAPALATKVAAALRARFGFEVPVVVKSGKELDAIVEASPLAGVAADPSRLLVVFAQDPSAIEGLRPLAARVSPPEVFELRAEAAYLHCPLGLLESKAGITLVPKNSGLLPQLIASNPGK